MKVFITGSSGFIGEEIATLLQNKCDVVEYDLKKGKDILDKKSLRKDMKGCEVVLHMAALRKPYEDKDFSDYFEVNCKGTFNVAEAAKKNKVKKLIFTSSTSYYGLENGIDYKIPIKEDNSVLTQFNSVSDLQCRDCDIAYSTSKVIAEQILANYGLTKKFEVIVLRLGPTRKRGEYRPFGDIKAHLKIENALQAIEKSLFTKKKLWYEAFTITDENKHIDISKAKRLLDYDPVSI